MPRDPACKMRIPLKELSPARLRVLDDGSPPWRLAANKVVEAAGCERLVEGRDKPTRLDGVWRVVQDLQALHGLGAADGADEADVTG